MEKLKQKISEKVHLSSRQGSILAYSLIVMSIMLMIAVGISSVSLIGKKSASTSGSSTQTLQTADSGIKLSVNAMEAAIGTQQIIDVFKAANANFTCNDVGGSANVEMLSAHTNLPGKITVSFTDKNGGNLICTDSIDKIANIQSIATYENTTRAVRVALADSNKNILLLHADGAGNLFVDSSVTPNVISAGGGANQVNALRKFSSGGSLELSGGNSYLSIPYLSEFNFGTSDMTMDAWINKNGTAWAPLETIFAKWDQTGLPNPEGDYIFGVFNGKLGFASYSIDPSAPFVVSSASLPTTNTWTHVAIVKKGNVYTLYINGSKDGESTNATAFNDATNVKESIGMYMDASGNFNQGSFTGNIDELRVARSAQWSTNFTSPIAPY